MENKYRLYYMIDNKPYMMLMSTRELASVFLQANPNAKNFDIYSHVTGEFLNSMTVSPNYIQNSL